MDIIQKHWNLGFFMPKGCLCSVIRSGADNNKPLPNIMFIKIFDSTWRHSTTIGPGKMTADAVNRRRCSNIIRHHIFQSNRQANLKLLCFLVKI